VLEVVGPGLLVVKHRIHEDSAKFHNVAVFEGERVKVLSRRPAEVSDRPAAFRALMASEAPGSVEERDDVLLRLAVSMRAHRRGGTLLVVPAGTDGWRDSIVQPIAYAVEPHFTELADLARETVAEESSQAHALLGKVVDEVAGLTAVDGATVITDHYALLAFGVKIGRPDNRSRVERVVLTEPIEGAVAVELAPAQLGGTRHSSAAQFAQDQPDAVVLVASQDGHFTAFAWSPREGMVHAHRLETLLL
jgi:DNA integrity scanning protein DisA with diadenylate cyclase activity